VNIDWDIHTVECLKNHVQLLATTCNAEWKQPGMKEKPQWDSCLQMLQEQAA
jgi:hypothetical protein